jgi:hypothetical protein
VRAKARSLTLLRVRSPLTRRGRQLSRRSNPSARALELQTELDVDLVLGPVGGLPGRICLSLGARTVGARTCRPQPAARPRLRKQPEASRVRDTLRLRRAARRPSKVPGRPFSPYNPGGVVNCPGQAPIGITPVGLTAVNPGISARLLQG